MDAAMLLFGEKGFETTSIEDLAQAAGIGKGTFYTYFRTKNDLLYSFCEEALDIIHGELALTTGHDVPLLEHLMALFKAEFRYFTRNREFGRLYMQALVFPARSQLETHQAFDNRYFDILFPIFERARKQGELRQDIDLLYLAGHFYGLYLMTVSAWYSGYVTSETEIFDGMRTLFQQAMDGLAPRMNRSTNESMEK